MKIKIWGIIIFTTAFLIFVIIIGSCQIIDWKIQSETMLIIEPNKDILSTAEYVYFNPVLIPKHISIHKEFSDNSLCIYSTGYSTYVTVYNGVAWFINGSRIPRWLYDISFLMELSDYNNNQNLKTCLKDYVLDWLGPSIHLFEIKFQSNPFDPGISYQWSILINDTLPTSIPTLIPQEP